MRRARDQSGAADSAYSRRFHYGSAFVNDTVLNDQAERWLIEVANARRYGTAGERSLDRFERAERKALTPLAQVPCRRVGASTASNTARSPSWEGIFT